MRRWRVMRRIIVVGCQGGGKTSLALKLGRKLGLPVVHSTPTKRGTLGRAYLEAAAAVAESICPVPIVVLDSALSHGSTLPFLAACASLEFAPVEITRHCSVTPAIEVKADDRWMRPAPPDLT